MADHNSNDAVLQAIDTLISQRISNLDYDQTIICKITDASDAQNGHYLVNDGSISFDAYSENEQYAEKESVYVTVPKGDFTQKKVIISKYTADNNENPLAYKSPLDQMFIITPDIGKLSQLKNNGIVANGRQELRSGEFVAPGAKHLIWEYDFNTSDNASLRNNAVFDSLGIRCKFKCSLGTAYNMKQGNYGLALAIYSNLSSDNETNDSSCKPILFDISEMFGNPYMFLTYLEQSKVINIENLNNITKINIYLYQSDNFTYTQELDTGEIRESRVPNTIKTHKVNGSIIETEINPNIFVDDLEIYFGMNLANVEDDTFQIYCASSTTYNMETAKTVPNYNVKNIIPVWFNKDENGEYLGFSDGIHTYYDFHGLDNGSDNQPIGREYDELEYLDIAQYLERGAKLNQQDLTDRGIPAIQELLQIYAYAQDIQKYLEKMEPYLQSKLTYNINQILTDVRQYQSSAQQTATKTLRDNFLNASSSGLDSLWSELAKLKDPDNLSGWMQTVMIVLKAYGDYYTGQDSLPDAQAQYTKLYNLYNSLKTKIETVKTQVYTNYFDKFRDDSNKLVDDDVVAVWELWYDSTKKLFENVEDYLDKIQKLISLTNSATVINANNSSNKQYIDCLSWQISKITIKFSQMGTNGIEDYTTTREKTYASYANRYAIYWYKYNPGYKDENEKFMTANWESIGMLNEGLPTQGDYIEADDKNKYWNARPSGNTTVDIEIGDETKVFERIRAVLIYNHQIFMSNILEFTNERAVIDNETLDASKGLYIAITDQEYSTTEFDDNGDPVLLQEDTYNNKETYQLYGVTGYLVNQSERYKKRKLRARFRGAGNKGDNYLSKNCVIYWYIPLNATMIDVQRKDLIDAGFSVYDPSYTRNKDELDAEIAAMKRSDYSSDEAYQNAVQAKKDNFIDGKYPLPPSPYGNNYQQGYIMAWKNIQADQNTPDTVDVASTECFYQIKDYFIPSFTNNTIKCRVVKDSQYVYDAEQSFTFASYGTNGTDYSLCITPINNQAAIIGSATNGKALALKVAVYDVNGDIMQEETNNIKIGWEQNFGGAIFAGSAPDIIVSRIGADFGYNVLKAEVDIEIESYSEAERTATVNKTGLDTNSDYEGSDPSDEDVAAQKKTRKVTLTAYYPIPWAAADYYLEGPTMVVYNSMGSNPSYYNGQYKLYYGPTSANAHSEVSIDTSKSIMSNPYTKNTKGVSTLVRESLPKLKRTTADSIEKLELSVPSMYLENDYFAMVILKNSSGQELYKQPIMMMQNRFSSPMLNAWDGELTIDEKNGTILASMVGAGKKEDDNSFSGVLMGDVAAKSEDSATGAGLQGLYGFNHGEQAFAFKNDGTAFIGKAGKGRIEFDGNSGSIQSMSYTVNKLGMKIDMDDGEIDMRGAYVDKNNQSDAWQAVAQEEIASDGSITYSIPENQQGALNNNEQNGYDNSTKYTPTGSRVTISTRNPFLEIVSPSVIYTTESSLERAINSFWNTINYYKTKSDIEEYLHINYDLYDSFVWLNTGIEVVKKSSTYANNIKGTLNGQGFYIRIAEDIKAEDISESLINRISNFDATGYIYKTGVIERMEGEEGSGSTEATLESDIILFVGDTLYIQDSTHYYYYPIGKAPHPVSSLPTNTNPCIVGQNGMPKTKIKDAFGREINITYSTVSAFATAIYNTLVDKDHVNSLNYQSNLKIQLLQKSDCERIQILYSSNNGNKDAKTLMFVGTDKYYLQTDNFTPGSSGDSPLPYSLGRGLKFDLMQGKLEAYNFTLLAADPQTGSSIKLSSSGNPFFEIDYLGENRAEHDPNRTSKPLELIKITKSDFIINSQNWYQDRSNIKYSSGTQFDLKKGALTSYNFDLISYDTDETYEGSYVQISSKGNPYIQVHYKKRITSDTGEISYQDLNLLTISRSSFILQSQNWHEDRADVLKSAGTQINLSKGKITSYNFDLLAYNNGPSEKLKRYAGSYLRMNSTGEPYFKLHLHDTDYIQRTKVDQSQFTTQQLDQWVSEGRLIKYSSSYNQNNPYYVPTGDPKDGTYWTNEKLEINSDLITITNQKFIIQSANYNPERQTGMQIDLNTGTMNTYNFKLSVTGTTYSAVPERDENNLPIANSYVIEANRRGTFIIDGSDKDTPIKLLGQGDGTDYVPGNFKVYWDGSIEATTGLIGGWGIFGEYGGNKYQSDGTTPNPNYIPKGIYSYNPRKRSSGSGVALYAAGTAGNSMLRIAVGEKTTSSERYLYLKESTITVPAWDETNGSWKEDKTNDQRHYNTVKATDENLVYTIPYFEEGTSPPDGVKYYYFDSSVIHHPASTATQSIWKEDTTTDHTHYNNSLQKEASEGKPAGTYARHEEATEDTDARFMVLADGTVTSTHGKFLKATIKTANIKTSNIDNCYIDNATITNGTISAATITQATINNCRADQLTVTNGKFTGWLSATGGTIGGFTITASSLSGNGLISGGTISGATISGSTISGGSITIGGGAFAVDSGGNVTHMSGKAISWEQFDNILRMSSDYTLVGIVGGGLYPKVSYSKAKRSLITGVSTVTFTDKDGNEVTALKSITYSNLDTVIGSAGDDGPSDGSLNLTNYAHVKLGKVSFTAITSGTSSIGDASTS